MQKPLCILILLLLGSVTLSAQSVSVDYHKRLVETAQGLSTEKFLRFLEQGQIDDALQLVDTSFSRSKINYADTLTAYHRELSKYLSTTRLSIVVVTPEKKSNTYRCIYHNKKGYHFNIDLYYNKGKSNSPITRIVKNADKGTEKEKKTSLKQGKKTGSSKTKTSTSAARSKAVRKSSK